MLFQTEFQQRHSEEKRRMPSYAHNAVYFKTYLIPRIKYGFCTVRQNHFDSVRIR